MRSRAPLQNTAATRDRYRLLGENVAKIRTDLMKEHLSEFRSQLEGFARKHKGFKLLKSHNGGLISLQELCNLLHQRRKTAREAISEDDCLCAISKLKALGSGYEVISIGNKKLVRSVPTELNKDHNEILELAEAQGFVTVDEVCQRFSWSSGRVIDALDTLLEEGLAMIDDGHKARIRRYWFPCVSSSSGVGTLRN